MHHPCPVAKSFASISLPLALSLAPLACVRRSRLFLPRSCLLVRSNLSLAMTLASTEPDATGILRSGQGEKGEKKKFVLAFSRTRFSIQMHLPQIPLGIPMSSMSLICFNVAIPCMVRTGSSLGSLAHSSSYKSAKRQSMPTNLATYRSCSLPVHLLQRTNCLKTSSCYH
ncbi:hypothetical protein BDY21DRAFT_52666 [Lineolata rhizophorae]|uniref:Secreted protein n=1 Tax=Lineolata rhizophorae TaxID=578093 RepID=A0A6A6NZ23_9PEZI|nr:hypothetical protein BDY21DRAFT_52666 [Lineolata rhizophorae]